VWPLALALLTCVSIDFSNPLLPGVVRFDDSESVYALRADRPRLTTQAAALVPVLAARADDLTVQPRRPAGVLERRPLVRRADRPRAPIAAARGTPASDEDH